MAPSLLSQKQELFILRGVNTLRVVVADDHSLTLQGVSDSLLSHGVSIVGRAQSAAEAVSLVKEHTPDALVTVQNNGEPQQGGRSGLGTAHLDLYAPDKWSLLRNSRGMTQLLVRLEESALPVASVSR